MELGEEVTEERNAFALGCYWIFPSSATTLVMGCKSPGVGLWCWQVLWWVLVADVWAHPGDPGCYCLLTEMLMKGAKICLFSGDMGNPFQGGDHSKPLCSLFPSQMLENAQEGVTDPFHPENVSSLQRSER